MFTTEQKLPLEAGKTVAHGVCSEVNWKYYCLYSFVRQSTDMWVSLRELSGRMVKVSSDSLV